MRRIRKNKYALAGILTIVIFTMGLMLGLLVNEQKLNYIQQLSKTQSADYASLQFQFNYIENLETIDLTTKERCDVLLATLENNLKLLGPALDKIEAYEANSDTTNEDYIILKREYTIANLRYWILAEKSNTMCNTDSVSILYFYSENCHTCKDQGFVLSKLKKAFGDDLLVYPIDTNIPEPTIDVLRRQYKIYTFPTLIINGKIIDTYQDKNSLLKIICPTYQNKTQYSICRGF